MVEQDIDDSFLLGGGDKIMEEHIDGAIYASKDISEITFTIDKINVLN